MALSVLLHRSPVILAIPGTSSIQHLEENIGAAGISAKLTETETDPHLPRCLTKFSELHSG